MRQLNILWLSLSEATSIEIQPNLLKPLFNQPALAKQICFDYYVCLNTEDLSAGLSQGGFRAFVGTDSGFRGEAFGLSWGGFRVWNSNCAGSTIFHQTQPNPIATRSIRDLVEPPLKRRFENIRFDEISAEGSPAKEGVDLGATLLNPKP